MVDQRVARGPPWTRQRAHDFRKHHAIKLLGNTDPERLTGAKAAETLGISRNGLQGLIRRGAVTKHQVTDFAPWSIAKAELDSEHVQNLVRTLKSTGRIPPAGGCPDDQMEIF